MAAITIYIPKDLQELYNKLEGGEASRIFQQALKEYYGSPQTVEEVKRKLDVLYQDQHNINSKVTFLERRRIELEEEEKQLNKHKANMEEAIKEKEHHLNVTCKQILMNQYGLSEQDASRAIKLLSTEGVFEKYHSDIHEFIKEHPSYRVLSKRRDF